MFSINVKTNFGDVIKLLEAQEKQIRYATSRALNATGRDVVKALADEMPRRFDRPTRFTMNAWSIKPSSRENLSTIVFAKDIQARYLAAQIAGGTRRPGPHGIRLAGNIQLDAFGNIPRGLTNRLKAAALNGTLGPALARRLGALGKRRKGGPPIQLFYGKPTGKGWDKAPVGIWHRVPGTPGKLVPLVVFEDTPAKYEVRLPLEEIARRTVAQVWARNFEAAWTEAMRTAR